MNENQPSNKNKKKLPPFHLTERYPEVRQLLNVSLPEINSFQDDAIFVLDTNALLLPYKVSKESLDKIKDVYAKLITQGRLFVPEQAIREFFTNKTSLIESMYSSLTSTKNNAKNLEFQGYPLIKSLDTYCDAQKFREQINPELEKYRQAIDSILMEITSWQHNDPVSQIYGELFTEDVIVNSKLENTQIKADFDRRRANEIPPGYEDSDKSDDGIGDVIIWLTILELGKQYERHLLFVTSEKKPDWWEKFNKTPISPRLELIEEYKRSSKQKMFSIIELSDLLESLKVTKEVIEEVKSEEEQVLRRSRNNAIKVKGWKDIIIDVLEIFGGKATLGEIYAYIEDNIERELPEFWHSSVRKTLQIYSSDSLAFGGKEDLFQKFDKGYWGLRNNENE